MAVSVNIDVAKNNYFEKKSAFRTEHVARNCDSSPIENKMKASRKEGKKPELQRYRPRKRFEIIEPKSNISTVQPEKEIPLENSKTSSPSNDSVLGQKNSIIDKINKIDNSSSLSDNASKSSKNTKNRRPDIQVYTPKPKLIAQCNGKKIDLPVSKKEEDNSQKTSLKKNSSNKDHSEKNANDTCVPSKEIPSMLATKHIFEKHVVTNTSYRSESWADLMEDSDMSNSRSTPDDKLCNGYKHDVNVHASVKENEAIPKRRNRSSKPKTTKDDSSRRQRVRCNSHQSDTSYSTAQESNHELSKRVLDSDAKVSVSEDNRFNSLPSENRDKQSKGKRTPDPVKDKRDSVNVNALSDHVKSIKIHHDDSHQNKASDRKKWIEQELPPRFQKNKAQIHESTSPKHNSPSGGILKIPTNFDQTEVQKDIIETSLYVPKIYPEPPVYIHKQLFDPNNPSKPEIVNIPANHPTTHMSYANMSSKYCSVDSSYIPSVPSMGYIPPPQPPVINQQFCYIRPDMSVNSLPENFLNIRDVIAPPVQCPVSDVRLNSIYNRSPVCYGEVPHIPTEIGKKKLKPIVEKNLNDISLLERELTSLLAKGFGDSNLNTLRQCRWKLQLRYENIILADPKYCAERNPEQCLWKSCFYQIIETLRKKLDENNTEKEETKANLLNILSEGTVFYENLIEKQQETYGFNLTRILECESVNSALVPETIRIVLISTQKVLIYLGDLARYKEQVSQTANYGKARSWYSKAQQIAPKNGRPYHQLAILAFNTRRKLDAVYYYMRSLAASNPILSAKESLLSLFEETKRKYEQYEKKRKQEVSNETEILEENVGKRCEVWIKPDGSSNQRPAEVDKNLDSSEVKNLSDAELNKRFITSFLHVHGKLFTKVGMETFPDTLNHMLKEFYFLLQRSPLPITSSRLLQLLAINIYSVDNSSMKETGREHGGSSLLQEQALYTSMVMMSMLMERCQMLHIAHKSSPEYSNQMISDDLTQLLPCVKIWTDWMSCQNSLWAPPPKYVSEKLNIKFTKNVWLSFADLLSVLREIDLNVPLLVNDRKEGCEVIILEEDTQFAGFVPLLSALQDPTYAMLPFDKDQAKHCVRISRIQFFGDYLCGISPPCMEFDIESKKFVSLIHLMYSEEDYEGSSLHDSYDELIREEDMDSNLNREISCENPESNELQLLWSKKEALSKTKEQQEKYKAQVQAVLHKHHSQRAVLLKIKPKYLIPDTNCFIDHLRLFRNILASSEFHLIIPLVVINELDGLARGTRVNEHTSPEHASRVTVLSREAIHFLEEQFSQRNPRLRAITSKGSVLDTISFRSEEMGKNKGTNDDLILNCCLSYCEKGSENSVSRNSDTPLTLYREVVLLTDDRNLRVKALAHHVPVRDLLSFLQWANS